jgi:hypothetical protein
VGPYPSMTCMVSQPFVTGGNRSYLEFWAITGGPWNPGYITPTVAPELSIEQVVGAGYLMGGRTGTHMVPQVPLSDSAVRLQG